MDAAGRPQRAGCFKALRELAAEGVVGLPPLRMPSRGAPGRRRTGRAVPPPEGVPSSVEEIGRLEVRRVRTPAEQAEWNELMIREHPFGLRPLVGRQLRYTLVSEHGCLGAAGFSSCAVRLGARDEWIGWTEAQRRAHLDRIVALSRLLIRPGVECANLASKALGMLVEAFRRDFETEYGYAPWLVESFVEPEAHDGASLRAAGWERIGRTKGRGRQDRANRAPETIKDIYLYVLDEGFRNRLGVEEPAVVRPLAPGEGLDGAGWAQEELGGAHLGDRRLSRRLVSIASIKGRSPGLPFSEAVEGRAAPTAGFYRFLDQPDETEVSMENILAPHRARTVRRMRDRGRVLCIHDTTDLNYSTLLACEGLGVIGKNQTGVQSGGLRLHSSYAVSAEEGLPLGLLHWDCYAPELKPEHHGKDARHIPIEEKETHRWIRGLAACVAAAEDLRGVQVTHVMDREADFFELFHAWRHMGADHLLVRAKHNRAQPSKTADDGECTTLFESVAALPVMGQVDVHIPRKSARAAKGMAQPARRKRTARMALRWRSITIGPPRHGLSSSHAPVRAWIMHARETLPPADGDKPIEWFLLTTAEIHDEATAIALLDAYAKRWRIEDWHRILKTCCRVEEPAHRDAECLRRLIAINMVIAWRIHLMTLLGREAPDLPVHVLFSDLEIRVLALVSRQNGWPAPASLADAVVTVARMGGYMNRKHDPPPGAELLWRGHRHLSLLSQGLALASLP